MVDGSGMYLVCKYDSTIIRSSSLCLSGQGRRNRSGRGSSCGRPRELSWRYLNHFACSFLSNLSTSIEFKGSPINHTSSAGRVRPVHFPAAVACTRTRTPGMRNQKTTHLHWRKPPGITRCTRTERPRNFPAGTVPHFSQLPWPARAHGHLECEVNNKNTFIGLNLPETVHMKRASAEASLLQT